jgi:hypothetical protein
MTIILSQLASSDGNVDSIPGLSTLVNGLMHILLVGSMVFFVYVAITEVAKTRHEGEKRMKALALFCGSLIVVATQASGTSYADFMLGSLGGTKPLTFGAFGLIAPGAAGLALAWYFVRKLDRSEVFATRLLMLFGMLAVTQFGVMYAVAVGDQGYELGTTALPNISFVVGLFLYMLFNYDPAAKKAQKSGGLLARIRGREKSRPSTQKTFVGE